MCGVSAFVAASGGGPGSADPMTARGWIGDLLACAAGHATSDWASPYGKMVGHQLKAIASAASHKMGSRASGPLPPGCNRSTGCLRSQLGLGHDRLRRVRHGFRHFARHQLVHRINHAFHPDQVATSARSRGASRRRRRRVRHRARPRPGRVSGGPDAGRLSPRPGGPRPAPDHPGSRRTFRAAVHGKTPLTFGVVSGGSEAIRGRHHGHSHPREYSPAPTGIPIAR